MNAAPDLTMTALKMISALGIILGGMFILFYFSKRFMNRDSSSSNQKLIKIIASQYIGVKKNISLVEVPGAILVLGISNDTIRLLTKIEDQETLEKLRYSKTGSTPSFSDHLNRITSRFRITKSGD
jgi:flagellar biosynthetic protein FliO